MSLSVDMEKRLGNFRLRVAFESDRGCIVPEAKRKPPVCRAGRDAA